MRRNINFWKMLKLQSILHICCHRRVKFINPILRLFSQGIFTQKCLQKTNNHKSLLPKCGNLNGATNFLTYNLCSSSSVDMNILSERVIETQSSPSELAKVMKFLISKGCTSDDIEEKCLQYINTPQSSYLKALLVSELHSDIVNLMPLMSVSLVAMRMAAKQARDDKDEIVNFPDRISYLSHHLETPLNYLIPALAKHSSLLTMQFKRLEYKMNILKDANISPKYIIKDLWIFNYNEKLLVSRITAAQKEGVELKPWMLRCSESIFESIIIKNSETQRVLKGEDELNYLAKRLDCSKEYLDYIMERNKMLKTINIPKLDQVLNFLYGKGYTPQEVRLFPRVFCSSVQTLNKRFEEFRGYKSTLPTISQLCLTNRKLKSKFNKKSSPN